MAPQPRFTRRQGLGLAAAAVAGPALAAPAPAQATAGHGWVERTLRRMSLEEKVGQLFVCYAYGATADSADDRNLKLFGVRTPAEALRRFHLGGMIYFAWTDSLKDPRQIARLSNGLQRVAVADSGIPLQIGTDQEHGVVYRVGPPATQFPGTMALGAGRSARSARRAAGIGGQELRAVGVTTDFAPVADVNVNPLNPVIGVRAFSSDPDLVSELVAAQVRGYQRDGRVVATAKHFPGHGDTETDSHTGLPVINHSRREWEELDEPPFVAAIRAGIDAIMTAHIVVPALDPSGDPATLSRPILTGLLRKRLGFDGLIVTDSLEMAAVREKYGDAEVAVRSLEAGADQLLMPVDVQLAWSAVLAAVRSGRIGRRQLDDSVRRILRLKVKTGVVDRPYVDLDRVPKAVGTPAHYRAAQEIADETITLVRNDDHLLPLRRGPRTVLVAGYLPADLATALDERGATTIVRSTGATPTDAMIADAVAAAGQADLTVVLTMKAWDTKVTDRQAKQQKLVADLLATGRPVVVAAVRDPYDVGCFPAAATTLATYSYAAVSLRALAKVLYGEIAPAGRLPVEVPVAGDPTRTAYPFGHGLEFSRKPPVPVRRRSR